MSALTIYYNGVEYNLEEGQTATLPCAGLEAATDFTVEFHAVGSFTYDGIIAVGETGKRCGLACAGILMETDIYITTGIPNHLKSPLPFEVKTAEEMNTILRLATDESIGAVYKYVGDESDVYDTNELYILTQEDA